MSQTMLRALLVLVAVLVHTNCQTPQLNVITEKRGHSGFLSVWLNPAADFAKCAKPFSDLQQLVFKISKNMSDESKSVLAGVGFGSKMYIRLCKASQSFEYVTREGTIGLLPASGGDLFFHAKSNSKSKLFELNQLIMATLPDGCLDRFEDHYSFPYKGCRDMSGFIDGTKNPNNPERSLIALNSETGGSFAVTQRWVHDFKKIASLDRTTKESFIGRSFTNSTELQNKSSCSHVAKMTGGTEFKRPTKFQMWRQSQPYGTVQGPAGLFFIGFANSTANFDFMLDAMVGMDGTGVEDCIFHITQCVSGNYWYFPGLSELKNLGKNCSL